MDPVLATAPHQPPPVRLTAGPDDGEVVAEATAALSALVGAPPAVVLTPSCTDALEAAAALVGVGPGDEVVVPAFTFPSTANAVLLRGARVRFADVDPRTGNLDPRSLDPLLGPRTRAVVCVHYGGVACDLDSVVRICEDAGVELVEDAAHGLFGSWHGTPLGRVGRFGCLSFHRTKNVSTGEGGALLVNRPDDVEAAVRAADKGTNRAEFAAGLVPAYEWVGTGSAWRMPAPLARVLLDELVASPARQARRHEIWDRYARELAPWAHERGVALPVVPPGRQHPAHLFSVLLADAGRRAAVIDACAAQGVEVAQHYGSLPDSRFGRAIRHPDDRCPVAADLSARLLRLPLHHGLTDHDVERVLHALTTAPV